MSSYLFSTSCSIKSLLPSSIDSVRGVEREIRTLLPAATVASCCLLLYCSPAATVASCLLLLLPLACCYCCFLLAAILLACLLAAATAALVLRLSCACHATANDEALVAATTVGTKHALFSLPLMSDWLPINSPTDGATADQGALEPCTVAYARRPIASGEELWNSYGEHPSFVFATHFGFVPGAAASVGAASVGAARVETAGAGAASANGAGAGATEEDRECWACELHLGGDGAEGRIGPSIVLAAQVRAAEMMEGGDYSFQRMGEDEDEEEQGEEDEDEGEADEEDEEDLQLALASLLLEAYQWASYPLKFILSREVVSTAAAEAAEERMPSREYGGVGVGAAALLTCARLCALDSAELDRLSASRSVCGEVDEEQIDAEHEVDGEQADDDPNAALEHALRRLLFTPSGRLSAENDEAAAELIREAARRQLRAVEAAEAAAGAEHELAVATPSMQSFAVPPRAACVALAQQTRVAEAFVLRELINGGAEAMLGRAP